MHTQTKTILHLAGLAVVASLQLTVPSAHAQILIDPATNYPVGNRPSGVAAGDFDNDGDIDIATTVDDPDRIIVLLNNGSGQYTLGPTTFLPNSSSPQDLVAGDLDGKGGVDLAVAVRDPQGLVLIMLNTGGGSFMMSGSIIVGNRPRGLAIADMDNDGDFDLAVANRDANTVSVLTNTGGGLFTVSTFFAGNEPRATAFVDFDNDGDRDLAVTIHDDRTVATFTNNGGVFAPSTIYSLGPFVRPDGIVAADLDGDGADDLAVAVDDQTFNINQIAVLINTGKGFTGPFSFDTGGQGTNKVTAADFDCDGAIDIAVTNQDSNNVSFLENLGGGVFAPPTLMGAGTRPGAITTADVDGDGDPDIAVANRDSNNLSVLINQSCEPAKQCPWDIDGDGSVGVPDLLALLGAWGTDPGGPPDFDGDGTVGVKDMLFLLANWGPCP